MRPANSPFQTIAIGVKTVLATAKGGTEQEHASSIPPSGLAHNQIPRHHRVVALTRVEVHA